MKTFERYIEEGKSILRQTHPNDKYSLGHRGRRVKVNHKRDAAILVKKSKEGPESITPEEMKKWLGYSHISVIDFEKILDAMWDLEESIGEGMKTLHTTTINMKTGGPNGYGYRLIFEVNHLNNRVFLHIIAAGDGEFAAYAQKHFKLDARTKVADVYKWAKQVSKEKLPRSREFNDMFQRLIDFYDPMNEAMGKDHPDVRNPDGKLFKDKRGNLHLVVGGSRATPLAIEFDPKWGQISGNGTFANSLTNGDWIPWTKMVKKAMVKKFIMALERELDELNFDKYARVMIDSEWQGKEAIKYLKRMGR